MNITLDSCHVSAFQTSLCGSFWERTIFSVPHAISLSSYERAMSPKPAQAANRKSSQFLTARLAHAYKIRKDNQ